MLKSKGNKAKFEHQQLVLDELSEAKDSLACAKYEEAKEAISLLEKRIKVIKLADRSEFGRSTVKEYSLDELVPNSEDEKRIFRSERRSELCIKQASNCRRDRDSSFLKEVKSTRLFEPSFSSRFSGQSGLLQYKRPTE